MINGVNFQPGAQDREAQPNSGSRPSGSSQGVQEAIKVLSLRLPKVVGAQAVSPSALLQSQGSGGNSRVDSIVQSVLQKFFPQATQGQAPGAPTAPSVMSPSPAAAGGRPESDYLGLFHGLGAPRVTVGGPPSAPPPTPPMTAPFTGAPRPGQPTWDSGGFPNGLIAPLPDLRRQLDWLPPTPDIRDRVPEI